MLRFALTILAAVTLAGCASSHSASSYGRGQTRQEMTVRFGTIESLRPVSLESDRGGSVGTVTGAMLGGLAGSNVGGGRGAVAATVLGAVAGGAAGAAVEGALARRDGVEVTVRLDTGQYIAVVQEADQDLRPGDRVRVLSGGGTTRVTR